jgi:hypothetical protein
MYVGSGGRGGLIDVVGSGVGSGVYGVGQGVGREQKGRVGQLVLGSLVDSSVGSAPASSRLTNFVDTFPHVILQTS